MLTCDARRGELRCGREPGHPTRRHWDIDQDLVWESVGNSVAVMPLSAEMQAQIEAARRRFVDGLKRSLATLPTGGAN